MPQAQYTMESTREVAAFLDSVDTASKDGGSAAVLDSIKHGGAKVPKHLEELLGRVSDKHEAVIMDSVQFGVREYEAKHGVKPTADVVEAALQQGLNAARYVVDQGSQLIDSNTAAGQRILDAATTASATSAASAGTALQANRAVVAIISAIAEAVPFAAYLPVDIASNQSKLAILNHIAGSAYGDYGIGSIMDGVSVGDVYTSSQRMVRITDVAGAMPALPFTTKFTGTNLTADKGFCDPAGTGVPVLRYRTAIYVNGQVAAIEPTSGSAATSPLSGTITLSGTSYTITGTINPSTGVLVVSAVSPALPAGTEVYAQAFVDYEAAPALIPSVIVRADTYDIYANPWRVKTGVTIDASTQLRNELGLDGNSEALMAIRTQMAMERHYLALRYIKSLGKNLTATHNFNFSGQSVYKTRAMMWLDVAPTIAAVDQKMAEVTMDHGITHIYVSAFVASQLQALPAEIFQSSGITARPGVYRVGRLFGKYEVYYSPKLVDEAADQTTSQMVCVGRSTQVARCPVVMGDAVAPTFMPLALNADFIQQSGLYARDYTVVNPHAPSALGAAIINLTNMK